MLLMPPTRRDLTGIESRYISWPALASVPTSCNAAWGEYKYTFLWHYMRIKLVLDSMQTSVATFPPSFRRPSGQGRAFHQMRQGKLHGNPEPVVFPQSKSTLVRRWSESLKMVISSERVPPHSFCTYTNLSHRIQFYGLLTLGNPIFSAKPKTSKDHQRSMYSFWAFNMIYRAFPPPRPPSPCGGTVQYGTNSINRTSTSTRYAPIAHRHVKIIGVKTRIPLHSQSISKIRASQSGCLETTALSHGKDRYEKSPSRPLWTSSDRWEK